MCIHAELVQSCLTLCSDCKPKKRKFVTGSTFSPSICPEVIPVGIGPPRSPVIPQQIIHPAETRVMSWTGVIRTLLGSLGPPGLLKNWGHLNVSQQQREKRLAVWSLATQPCGERPNHCCLGPRGGHEQWCC